MMSSSGSRGYARFTDDITNQGASGGYGTAGPSDQDDPYNNSNVDHRARHAELIRQQDAGLENLSNVISRQKELAVGIGREVESQNDLIEDITTMADHTNDRLRRTTNNVDIVARKSNTCLYWVVIALLACAIVAVAAIPF